MTFIKSYIMKNKTNTINKRKNKNPKSKMPLSSKSIKIGLLFFILYLIYSNTVIKNPIKKTIKEQKLVTDTIKNVFKQSLKYEEFDEKINKQYIQFQNYFCDKQNETSIPVYEKRIKKANVDYNGNKFEMFVHSGFDFVSESILDSHQWEGHLTQNILQALEYYTKKKNLKNNDVYFLDIGANVGYYTYYIGKYGYKVMSFEAWELNNYIMFKNYCLNRDVDVTIINKGLDSDDKKCILKTLFINQGNGIILCKDRDKFPNKLKGEIINNVELTKLDRYIKFFSNKNIGVIKMDVEGSEGNVIEGGKELISKYHVPFILLEYNTRNLENHGTNVVDFLQFFVSNGYKITLSNFLGKYYISPLDISRNKNDIELFIVYDKFLE